MKTHKPMPPLDFVNEKLEYNEETGDLIWKTGPRKGRPAGSKMSSGRQLEFYIDGVREPFLNHRIIWYMKTGEDPGEALIDHKDGVKLNNVWSNLRKATHAQNGQNKKCTTSATGYTGVVKRGNRFMAYAYCKGKQVVFGRADTPEEAFQIYLDGIDKLFGEFSPRDRYDDV